MPFLKTATEWSEDLVENHEEKEKVTSNSSSEENKTATTKITNEQPAEHLKGSYVNAPLITFQIMIDIDFNLPIIAY